MKKKGKEAYYENFKKNPDDPYVGIVFNPCHPLGRR